MNIGYWKHWTQPDYTFFEFLKEQGYQVEEIDYKKRNYLEKFDILLIEQNGFNDYAENDEIYIFDWVKRGGILLFMHQDYQRWAPTFLPQSLGFVQLIHRNVYANEFLRGYMMPWVDYRKTDLFTFPEKIEPMDMVYWSVYVGNKKHSTTSFSTFLPDSKEWTVLGEYQDPAVRNGALIMEAKYGKGMIFLSQILFPERRDGGDKKIFDFWKKYTRNLLSHFDKFKKGEEPKLTTRRHDMPLKKNYNVGLHVHSLDWYGCHSSIGTLYAGLREYNYDVAVLAIKDTRIFNGNLQLERYSDEHLLFLPGQEYHPFDFGNFGSGSWNDYHTVTLGVPEKDITFEFTKTIYSAEQRDAYLEKVINFVHSKGGLAGATHVCSDVWRKWGYDMVDLAPLRPLQGTDIEKHWLSGQRITLVNSIDMWGVQRLEDYPAGNFVYTSGVPSRESVVNAVRAGHVIAGTFFKAADVTWGKKLPGDSLTVLEGAENKLHISAELYDSKKAGELLEIRVFAGPKLIRQLPCQGKKCDVSFEFAQEELLQPFLRVEVLGLNKSVMLASNPFYLTPMGRDCHK